MHGALVWARRPLRIPKRRFISGPRRRGGRRRAHAARRRRAAAALAGPSPPLDFGSSWVSGGQWFYSPLLIPAPGPGPGSGSIDLLWDFFMAVPQTPRSVRGSGYGAQLAAVARRDPDRPPAPRLRGDPGEARAIASFRTRSLPVNRGVLHMNDSGVRRDGTLALAPWPSTAFQPWFSGFGVVSVSSIQR